MKKTDATEVKVEVNIKIKIKKVEEVEEEMPPELRSKSCENSFFGGIHQFAKRTRGMATPKKNYAKILR